MKVLILAPIFNSLYARIIAFALSQETGIELSAIIVRSHLNLRRFISEFHRDGKRLLNKIYAKLLAGDRRFTHLPFNNLSKLANEMGLPYKTLREIARGLRIPYKVVQDHNHPQSLQIIRQLKPDLIIFTGGGLLRDPILQIPRLGILNCHTGILPNYRGMDVVEWTAAEEKIDSVGLGVTLHFMDQGVDTGPILKRNRIFPKPGDSFESIRADLETCMVNLMIEGVIGLNANTLSPLPQSLHAGKQYFVMHPRIKSIAASRLTQYLGKTPKQ